MKIIAKAGDQRYLLQASSEEIDLLAGRKVCRGNYGDDMDLQYVLGTEFDIVAAFAQIHRNQSRKREIETVRATLAGLINGLDLIAPFIEEPIERKDEELASGKPPVVEPGLGDRARALWSGTPKPAVQGQQNE